MPKRDDEYMAARRDEILDAAKTCFLRNGLAGASTTAICKEAGISMGALYTHFPKKSDILLALAERSASERRNSLASVNGEGLRAALAELVDGERSETGKAISRFDLQLISMKSDAPELAAVIDAARDNQDFTEALGRLGAEGALKDGVDPLAAAVALESMLMGFKVLSLIRDKHSPQYQASVALLLDLILRPPSPEAR